MADINSTLPALNITLPEGPQFCIPLDAAHRFTTVTNANILGWLGFASGALMVVLFWIGFRYVGPWIISKGRF